MIQIAKQIPYKPSFSPGIGQVRAPLMQASKTALHPVPGGCGASGGRESVGTVVPVDVLPFETLSGSSSGGMSDPPDFPPCPDGLGGPGVGIGLGKGTPTGHAISPLESTMLSGVPSAYRYVLRSATKPIGSL